MIRLREAQATKEDIELINKLAAVVFPATYSHILSEKQLKYMFEMMYSFENIKQQITLLGHTYFIATFEGLECGYISIEEAEPQLFVLQKIYVLPQFQGHGIGRELINFVKLFVQKRSGGKRSKLELHVNRNNKAINFYDIMGFKIDRSDDFDIGDGFYMNDHIMAMDI